MKKRNLQMTLSLLAVTIATLCLSACGGKDSDRAYTISGTLPSGVEAEWIYLYSTDGDMPVAIDSAAIQKGSFTLKGIAPDTLRLVALHPGTLDQYPAIAWSIFLEPGDMVIDTNSEFVGGTPINDGFRQWMGALTDIMMGDGTPDDIRDFLQQHWGEHSADLVGALTLAQMSPYLDFPFVDSLTSQVPAEVRGHYLVAGFFEQLEGLRRMQPGQPFTDISLVTIDGKPASLSDFIGKGSYALVDFWASWCGPCRQAMPELQGIVKKFPKLTVFGIAVSDKVEDTQKAVNDLAITWPVLSDPEATSAKAYGISAIPAMILFAPDGTILARDFNVRMLEDILGQNLK